jgi:hypothetical protein
MKKSIGLFLVIAACVITAEGCKQPVVTAPDPAGNRPIEVIEAQDVNASPGGRGNSGAPAVQQTQETVAPPQ